ncbi:MAG: hypothetical protein HYS07_06355 [Chlamydiae bacterium]|nr:hypothetical protein [Chlamydiota bacterium]MBI3276543.1 hypothetical protein [Chlamydiota bacterium]
MEVISSDVVKNICFEMRKYPESRMSQEASRFLRQQPQLVQFLQEFTQDFKLEVQQLSLYLSYWIWKACTKGWGRKMPRLDWTLCYHCFLKERETWKDQETLLSRKSTQPHLIHFLGNLIQEDHSDLFKEDVGKSSIVLILRCVIAAFEKAVSHA